MTPTIHMSTREKPSARENWKKKRFDLLCSMTKEDRLKFLQEEKDTKIEIQQRLRRAATTNNFSQQICIDLSFDSIMNEKEIRSLANQLKHCYAAIKRMSDPFQFVYCNPSEQLEHSLTRFGAENWYIQWRRGAESVADHFSPKDLVYLSPDSPHVLSTLDRTKIYVIGGIVDKSRKKGVSLNAAIDAGIATARLPIQEYVPERLDHILNVNTVVDVLIKYQELNDWPHALEIALPQRKRSQIGRKAIRRRQNQSKQDSNKRSPSEAVSNQGNPTNIKQLSINFDAASILEEGPSPIEDLYMWFNIDAS
ncbi:hypothetical protein CCR75_005021 [Bremia lactucae]|uniref:tRNA (guanine(9)-N(1))-methyltransferase n=1 Tax=Bremia lactucae TaxID=4779 RepID=A0A976FMJ1_BRELC|nr:hypothetical protein CCR75_005019 [Bremia lactucae]TDH69558.1 hypothetical protein CCR75_005021 [Bremia lactucae]